MNNPPTMKKAIGHLFYVCCPNCNRKVGAMSIDTKGIQQYICKDSRCRNVFYVVDGKIREKVSENIELK